MKKFTKRLRALWQRRQLDRDLEEELRFHLEMKAEEMGDLPEARRRLGNVAGLKEACRDLWSFTRLESWWQDIRFALRMLAKSPGFTAVAVIALALGIGADTAVFTIVHGAFAWNLGLDNLDRIVLVGTTDASRNRGFGQSYPDFRDLRSQTKSLAGLAAYQFASVNVSDGSGLPERYYRVRMSTNGFSVIEQKPILGRDFTPEDEKPGAPAVLMLTYHVWEDRYGKDPNILGKTVRVNDEPMTVIGVMPPGRRFPEDTSLWTPLIPDAALEKRGNRDVAVFGRLADGISVTTARTELEAISGRLASEYPATNKGLVADVRSIAWITGAYAARPLFVALWCAVGFVLLIACADVANMLLARGAGRIREISIRVAIGAGRARILRQLLIESILLAVAGGLLGWVVALAGLRWFDAGTGTMTKPIWLNLTLDRTAFTYLAAVSAGTGILFGLVPALRLSKVDVNSTIKDGGQGAVGGTHGRFLSNLLVVSEMVLCIVLLVGAGLMIRSTVNLFAAPMGVNTADVLTMRINLSEKKYPQPNDLIAFHRELKARLQALPGVEAAAITSHLPMSGALLLPYEIEGSIPDTTQLARTGALVTSAGYFPAMRLRPTRGRSFTESDGLTGPPIVIVNETFAAKFWPNQDALGKRIRIVKDRIPQEWMTVVGVVPDVLQNARQWLQHDPLMYLPYAEQPLREVFISARTRVLAGTLTEAFRRTVRDIDENLPVYEVNTLEARMAQRRLEVTLLGGMFTVFAGIALVLASVGLYAVIAHTVSQRTPEIGIRMALGGTRRDILKLVLTQGMRPLAVGIAIGLPAAFGVTHILRTGLIGVTPGDPLTFFGVVVVLVVAGLLGCAMPARRATRVDPVVALRCS